MDQIVKGEIQVEWCPTKDMIADIMTKPLQGSLFRMFSDLIMGAISLKEMQKILTHNRDQLQGFGTQVLVPKECVRRPPYNNGCVFRQTVVLIMLS